MLPGRGPTQRKLHPGHRLEARGEPGGEVGRGDVGQQVRVEVAVAGVAEDDDLEPVRRSRVAQRANVAAEHGHGHAAILDQLQRTLAGFAHHPNVGGVVIFGLGCEMNQVEELISSLSFTPRRRQMAAGARTRSVSAQPSAARPFNVL